MGNEAATAVDRSLRRLPSVKRVEQEDLVKSQRNFLESFDEFKEMLNSTKKGQRKRAFAESARVQQPLVRATAWLLSTALKLLTKEPGKNSGDKQKQSEKKRVQAIFDECSEDLQTLQIAFCTEVDNRMEQMALGWAEQGYRS